MPKQHLDCPLCVAVDALDAARAPKKPMTAEHWWGECMVTTFDRHAGKRWGEMSRETFLRAATSLESAAWDRAISEVQRVTAKHRAPYAWREDVDALKGKCHEGGATT